MEAALNSSEFVLSSGHTVRVLELRQSRTYEGLLEGLPTTKSNARTLEYLVKAAAADYPRYGAPLLLPCKETLTPWEEPQPYPFGTPATLPGVICIARLGSLQAARDGDWSAMIVIWLQNDFAFPIAEPIMQRLIDIDWARLATDFEY